MAALSQLAKDIRRFHELQELVKPANKELEALKTRFRDQAGPAKDTIFTDSVKKLEVVVTREEQTRVDLDALRAKLGAEIEKFNVVSPIMKVTGRKAATTVAA